MILTLYGFLVALSFLMVVIGLIIPNHTEQTLIGFFFLFLLSFVIINGNLEYKTGYEEFNVYGNNLTAGSPHWDNFSLDPSGNPAQAGTEIVLLHTDVTFEYSSYDDSTTHNIGYWMAIGSAFGFIITLYSIRGGWGKQDD